jgi:hypothetical protein
VWLVLEQAGTDGELPQLDAERDFVDEGASVAADQRIPADGVRRLQSLLRHQRQRRQWQRLGFTRLRPMAAESQSASSTTLPVTRPVRRRASASSAAVI